MKVKRFLLKAFKRFFKKVLILFVFVIVTSIIYNDIASSDLDMQEGYAVKKAKCDLLRTIASDAIEEGKGIDIQQISSENIRYKIHNEGENVFFYYYIEEEYSGESMYNAKITLSNDFKILKESYSIEIEDYEKYKCKLMIAEILLSVILAILSIVVVCGICVVIYTVIEWCLRCLKNKKCKGKTKIDS